MAKKTTNGKDSSSKSSAKLNLINENPNLEFEEKVQKWKTIADKLSYEESLEELDRIMLHFQSENVQVEDLQNYYLKAKIYLTRCVHLLDQVEQEVIQLDTDKIDINT